MVIGSFTHLFFKNFTTTVVKGLSDPKKKLTLQQKKILKIVNLIILQAVNAEEVDYNQVMLIWL